MNPLKDCIASVLKSQYIAKIDQKTLAELAGVSINTLTKIERGESNPSVNVLTKILDTLGMDIKIIIKGN